MRKIIVFKWLGECFLIVISVLLAFYLEQLRQSNEDKNDLIEKLQELRISITRDTTLLTLKFQKMLLRVDDSIKSVLRQIDRNVRADNIIATLDKTMYYFPINNWTLERILQDKLISRLSLEFQNSLHAYKHNISWTTDTSEKALFENDNSVKILLWSNLAYDLNTDKLDLSELSQPLISLQFKDSTILYSDELKTLLVYKMKLLRKLRAGLETLPAEGRDMILKIDKELEEFD